MVLKNPHPEPLKSVKARNPLAPQPTYDSRKGMYQGGDYYGTGFKAKIGKMRGDSAGASPIPPKALRIAPESVV